jgi:ribosomal protein S18 acetylase RimI-like enzyme
MPVKIRDFTDKDLPTLIDLLNERDRGSYEFVPMDEERLRTWLQEGKLRILMAVDSDEVLGSVSYNDSRWGEEIEWLVVLEGPDKKTLENQLVTEAEKYVKGTTVFTGVDADSPRIEDWVERGYKLEGGLYHMVARLDSVKPLPEVPEGIILRSLKSEEEKLLVETVNAVFDWERIKIGFIQEWKALFPPFNEEWIHVAEQDNRIVSVVASRPDANYNKAFGGKRGYLGPAATLSEYRNKNLASALTCRATNLLFERGMDSVALYASEQNVVSVTLLRKLGFEVGHHWRFMRKHFERKNQEVKP